MGNADRGRDVIALDEPETPDLPGLFGLVAAENPRSATRKARSEWTAARARISPEAVGRTARELRDDGLLLGDVAGHAMAAFRDEYERRMTAAAREHGASALRHARHLELRFGADGLPVVELSADLAASEGTSRPALEALFVSVRDYFAPSLSGADAGAGLGGAEAERDERVWWAASEWLHAAHLAREGAASDGVSLVPTDPGAEPYRTLVDALAGDYLGALDPGAGDLDTAQLETLVGVRTGGAREAQPVLRPRDDHLDSLTWHGYHAFRTSVERNTYGEREGSRWPVADLMGSRGVIGHAVMRPPETDRPGLLDPEQVEHWAAEMWRQRAELSDLHADVLDALTAIWLYRSPGNPERLARAGVDEIISMRSPNAKKNSEGRGQGYRPEQRQEVLQAIAHIENIWLDMGEKEVLEERPGGGRPRKVTKQLHSRAIAVTDVETALQPRLDGFARPDAIWFRLGKVFSYFLDGPGRQVGLLAAQALRYHRKRERWEKRLTRNLSFRWRVNAGSYRQPFRVAQLLRFAGEELDERRPSATRDRLEGALDRLAADGGIAAWEYDAATFVDPLAGSRKGWAEGWLSSRVVIEPPDVVKDFCDEIADGRRRKTGRGKNPRGRLPSDGPGNPAAEPTLGGRLRAARKAKGFSQTVLADRLGISQAHLSQIERGRKDPTADLSGRIEAWLARA